MSTEAGNILEARNISKSFGGVKALIDINIAVRRGEVHAVIGENGAGKTTLMNIFGGIIRQDKGELLFDGKNISFNSPREAFKEGISTIHQELTMLPHLNVMENIFLGQMQKFNIGRMIINGRKLVRSAEEALDILDLSMDLKKTVSDLSISEQQEIEIIKALSGNARLIIMDEPNSSLTDIETRQLFMIIEKLKSKEISVIYVSHKIDEVLRIADRITVLRDGRNAGTIEKRDATTTKLFRLIAGRDLKETLSRGSTSDKQILLNVKNAGGKGFSGINFNLFRGEILGFYGLVGSGRSELARALYGADILTRGTIEINNKFVKISSPAEALKKGIAMVPEDRKDQGLFMNLSVLSNMTLSSLKSLSHYNFFLRSSREKKIINDYIEMLHIKMDELNQPISNLSGGNQQKVILARNLMTRPGILILDEPTHGIDIGAKEEIHTIIRELASQGVGIILISSEMPEILAISNRIAVLHEGKLAGILNRDAATEEKLIAYATGYINETSASI
ncbi:MAG TPA: sugar ABC transporter ATP-binding protein [Bacteroidales bacterium]|jgi:ABC-type sugar transport system ATPase subunit|nr:ATP-binding cassette domain-containing protein [Bacteroidales bacterium]OQB62107.1 MAG: Ribose import ATP-binding protein RbsA [Bacteroidetes bacterium ADurb.Bin145]NMD03289.1 sugar ABC transporter ATP-binding protein [Bacteroidales bacterium]HOU00892.1 sugar ABC transporter ATP-binding protein [Bacteroidales bacterium]HQG62027.1 sugar ABC transporter ATP-binding protein [Bacteroidales bacterium]